MEFNNGSSSADRGLVDKGTQLLLPIQLQERFGRFAVNSEIGYNIHEQEEDERIYGLAFGRDATGRLELPAEMHETASSDFKEDEEVFNPGSRFKLTDACRLLVSAGRGFGNEPRLLLFAGLQFNL